MANLLANPELWDRGNLEWDGTSYVLQGTPGNQQPSYFSISADDVWASPGDTVSGTFQGSYLVNSGSGPRESIAGGYIVIEDTTGASVPDTITVDVDESGRFHADIPNEMLVKRIYYKREEWDYGPSSAYGAESITTPAAELVANDDTDTVRVGSSVTTNVLANDTLGDDPVTLDMLEGPPTITRQPANGTVVVNANGTITYTPNPGFRGEDTYEYEILPPQPEACLTIYMNPYNYTWDMGDVEGDLPDWFDPNQYVELIWEEGEQMSCVWNSDNGYFSPSDCPMPPQCAVTPATLYQDGNTICVFLDIYCPA